MYKQAVVLRKDLDWNKGKMIAHALHAALGSLKLVDKEIILKWEEEGAKKVVLKVKDLMRRGRQNPTVRANVPVRKVLLSITEARAGSCTIVDAKGKLLGIFTDGDLRRHLRLNGESVLKEPVRNLATWHPLVIHQDKLAAEALHVLKTKRIDELPVVDDHGKAIGLLDVQDLLKAGFV